MNTKSTSIKHTDITIPKEKLMEDLRMVVADAEDLLRTTADQAGEGVAAARTRIQDSLQVVRERLLTTEDAMVKRAREAATDADRYVHDNPWQAIGVSACVGAIVGMLIARH
jgi:ElaB/YqjD/DUF883 family membrane-anchored ribosome-binding protein